MDWLIAHSENEDNQQSNQQETLHLTEPGPGASSATPTDESAATVAKSIKCDE